MKNPPDPSMLLSRRLTLNSLGKNNSSLISRSFDSDFLDNMLIPVLGTYCGLCGKQGRLTRTECCNRLVCDDRDDTILFIPSRPQCEYMHARYTVCSVHHNDGHDGAIDWRECAQCRVYFAEFESYVGFGTSSFNFAEDQWDEVPTFEPTYCSKCKGMMKLNSEAHSALPDGNMLCERCCGFS